MFPTATLQGHKQVVTVLLSIFMVIVKSLYEHNKLITLGLHIAEKAREHLHKTGRFIVIGGIISPVHDSYGKPVRNSFVVQFYLNHVP